MDYVENLTEAGVEAFLDVYPDWFHAYDVLFPLKSVSREAIRKFEEHFAYALEHYSAPQPEGKETAGKDSADVVK